MDLKRTITELSQKYYEEIVQIRRHIHQYPELAFEEHNTADYILQELKKIGLKGEKIANTGIVGLLKGNNPNKKVIALRADIDALPIEENNEISYKSKITGKMHACGHDVHTAVLLGVLKILNEVKDYFEGTIKFIFQPAEEKLPGGALELIKNKVLENPVPELIIGQHVYPELQSGQLGFKPGNYMASSDEIFITLKGKGGHGGMPEKVDDTVYLASRIITDLQQIVSRKSPSGIPTVLSFGKLIAEGATNVIPNEVKIEGTFRTMNEQWRNKAHEQITLITEGALLGTTCKADVYIKKGYPVLYNHPVLTQKAKSAATELLGNENVKELEIRMTAEDFAYYAQKIPGIFYRFGTNNSKNEFGAGLHTPHFNIDEEALKTGMSGMAWLAINLPGK
jgi:amidohydrolase